MEKLQKIARMLPGILIPVILLLPFLLMGHIGYMTTVSRYLLLLQ